MFRVRVFFLCGCVGVWGVGFGDARWWREG